MSTGNNDKAKFLEYVKLNDISFENVDISEKTKNVLHTNNKNLISDIVLVSNEEICKFKGIDKESAIEVVKCKNDYLREHKAAIIEYATKTVEAEKECETTKETNIDNEVEQYLEKLGAHIIEANDDLSGVLYPIGEEPENLKKRLDTLLKKIDEAYPFKIVYGLAKDHKKWAETLTDLYRKLGYPSGSALLRAYGFTIAEKFRNVKTNNYKQFVELLKQKYPNGSQFSKLSELEKDCADLEIKWRSFKNNSATEFGMGLSEYLRSIGLLCILPNEESEKPKAKKKEEVDWSEFESELEKLLESLKNKYKGKQHPTSVVALIKENPGIIDMKKLSKYLKYNLKTTPNDYLKEQGLIRKPEKSCVPPSEGRMKNPDTSNLIEDDSNSFVIKNGALVAYRGKCTNVVVPEGVTEIGYIALFGCSDVTTITIPASVTRINPNTFKFCAKLESINVDKNNKKFSSVDGVLFDKEKKILICCPSGKDGVYVVPDSVKIIGKNAFYKCYNIENITIPDGVEKINKSAFYKCLNLTEIKIPDSVTRLTESTFFGCLNLVAISIPVSITSIGEKAFAGCEKLEIISFSGKILKFEGTVLELVWNYFSKTGHKEIVWLSFLKNLSYDLLSDDDLIKNLKTNKQTIINYAIESGDIKILDKFFSLGKKPSLDELDEYIEKAKDSTELTAFFIDYKNKNYSANKREKHKKDKIDKALGIKPLTITECKEIYSFKKIGDEITITGYKGTDTDIIVPSNIGKYKVVAIDDNAFSSNLYNLKKEVEEVRKKIESVILPNSVTTIGDRAFYRCSNLTTINIPDSVTSIGDEAFKFCENLTTINIPDSVTSIGDSAFYDCKKLSSINIPDSVTSIGRYAFEGCKNLTTISIPDSVTSIGDSAFSGCENLTTITIPDSVTSIGYGAFSGCKNLTTINIPDSVTSIGDSAFSGCRNLITINIPDSVTSIGYGAFYGCENLTTINIPDSVTSIGDSAFSGCRNLITINIPDSVTSIGKAAFSGCENLTTLNIPDSVTSIGEFAFYGCTNLKDDNGFVIVKNTLYDYVGFDNDITIPDNITSIGDSAFSGCENLTTINIPDSVTSIGEFAFYGCGNLTTITIPDSVTSVGDGAFSNTSYYKNESNWENDVLYIDNLLIKAKDTLSGDYVIKPGTKTIADSAFSSCRSFTTINIPDGMVSIGEEAFKDCTNLTTINIPDGVTSIGDEVFNGCKKLTTINIPDSVTSIGYRALNNCENLTTINIPDGVTSIGDEVFNGCKKLTTINIPDSVTSIGYRALNNCENLTTINIPDGVTSIGDEVFNGCKKLTTINIPDSVTSIGYRALNSCENLTTITIPDSVTSIGAEAFSWCTNLTTINIPDSVTSIGSRAFDWCTRLTTINIPASVKSIGVYAFRICTNLTIHTPAGSYAEQYAQNNKINLVTEKI